MCGCIGPDALATAKDIAVSTAMIAAPVGIAVSLLASALFLEGGRRRLSWGMLAMGAAMLVLGFGEDVFDLNNRLRETLFMLFWAVFLFLGLLSLVYWPTRLRWVNLPLVTGVGVTLLAALSHALLVQWGAWIALSG